MIAEPFIFTTGPQRGEIHWIDLKGCDPAKCSTFSFPDAVCVRYADFEREKLKELGGELVVNTEQFPEDGVYQIKLPKKYETYRSFSVIRYCVLNFKQDSESGRVLNRAKFVQAVCEKEGVEWLPSEKCEVHTFAKKGSCACDEEGPCKAHGENPWHVMPSSGWVDENAKPSDRAFKSEPCSNPSCVACHGGAWVGDPPKCASKEMNTGAAGAIGSPKKSDLTPAVRGLMENVQDLMDRPVYTKVEIDERFKALIGSLVNVSRRPQDAIMEANDLRNRFLS